MRLLGLAGAAGSGKSTVAASLVERHGCVEVALADEVKRVAQRVYAFTDEQLWGPSELRNRPDHRYARSHGPWVADRPLDEHQCACCGAYEHDPDRGLCFLTPRFALQRLGTEFGRECCEDTWFCKVLEAVALLDPANPYGRWWYAVAVGLLQRKGADLAHFARAPLAGPRAVRCLTPGGLVVVSDVRFPSEMRAIRAVGGQVWRVERPGAGLAGAAGLHASETSLGGMRPEDYDAVLSNNGDLEDLAALAAAAYRDYQKRDRTTSRGTPKTRREP